MAVEVRSFWLAHIDHPFTLCSFQGYFEIQQIGLRSALKLASILDSGMFWHIFGHSKLSHTLCKSHLHKDLLTYGLKLGGSGSSGGENVEILSSSAPNSFLYFWLALKGDGEKEEKVDQIYEMEKKLAENVSLSF